MKSDEQTAEENKAKVHPSSKQARLDKFERDTEDLKDRDDQWYRWPESGKMTERHPHE